MCGALFLSQGERERESSFISLGGVLLAFPMYCGSISPLKVGRISVSLSSLNLSAVCCSLILFARCGICALELHSVSAMRGDGM